jgi:hypothetical protein
MLRDAAAGLLLTAGIGILSWYCWHAARDQEAARTAQDEAFIARVVSKAWFLCGSAAVLCSIAGIVITWTYLFLARRQDARFWLGISIGSSVLGLLCSWLGSFQVRLCGSTLEYWSLFGGYRALKQDDIAKARIEIGSSSYGDRFRPPIRLEILPGALGQSKQPVFINLKVFSRSDLKRIFDWLGSKLQTEDGC